MGMILISAKASCKRNGIDLKYANFIADSVGGTNAAYATKGGGVNRSNVVIYADRVARGISKMLNNGLSYDDIIKKSFFDFSNFQDEK